MNDNYFDVLIIGGGPAGSSAALFLNKEGIKTAIVEKKEFPREVLCGEFISKEVYLLLEELNLSNKFLQLKPNKINSFQFTSENNSVLLPLGFTAYAIKRGKFDLFLLNNCKEAGITVLQQEEVVSTEFENDFFLTTTNQRVIKSKFVIAAYGKQNLLDKKLNRNFTEIKSGLNGVKFHVPKEYLKSHSDNIISIFAGQSLYCGINTVDKETVTVCFLENRKNIDISPREHLKLILNSNKNFSKYFNDNFSNILETLPVYGTGNIYFGKRDLIKNNVLMTGDAAGVIAPLAGDGIGIAFQNGKLISEILKKYFLQNCSRLEINNEYLIQWNKLFNKRIKTALLIQNMIFNSFINKIVLNYIPLKKYFIKYLIKSTRG